MKLGLAEAAPAARAEAGRGGAGRKAEGAGLQAGRQPRQGRRRPSKAERSAAARLAGYQGDACPECGNFTLVRNGTCLKCDTCGSTTGCS